MALVSIARRGVAVGVILQAALACDSDCGETQPLRLPSEPTNLEALNSPYDDWNCADPRVHFEPGMSFLFSSNRATQGGSFDLQPHYVEYVAKSSASGVPGHEATTGVSARSLGEMADMEVLANAVRTDEDELGPAVLRDSSDTSQYPRILTWAQGSEGHHDLYVLYRPDPSGEAQIWGFLGKGLPEDTVIEPLAELNSSADDGYLTYHQASHSFLFHSNRSGTYRIYRAPLPPEIPLYRWMQARTPLEVLEVEGLSSDDGEERTPFVRLDTLYFVSNRSSGEGGLDLWKSDWQEGAWAPPVNLGTDYNSAQDEYRPMVLLAGGKSNFPRALFFSSNRSGGQGGFDLYLSGLE